MKIILVFKTHFDIRFTDLASNVIDQYAGSMLEQVIETCKEHRSLENGILYGRCRHGRYGIL